VNPQMPSQWSIPLGETAELLADRYSISREEQDAFTLASHLNAAAAWDAGIYDGEVIPVPGAALDRDEGIRGDASLEALAALRPAFRPEGTVTAGNSSPLNDGAGALIIGSEKAPVGSEPLARIVSRGVAGNDPDVFGIAPVEAANRALAKAGKTWADVDFVELNEAFASQSLACLNLWPELDPAKVNITVARSPSDIHWGIRSPTRRPRRPRAGAPWRGSRSGCDLYRGRAGPGDCPRTMSASLFEPLSVRPR